MLHALSGLQCFVACECYCCCSKGGWSAEGVSGEDAEPTGTKFEVDLNEKVRFSCFFYLASLVEFCRLYLIRS